MIFKVKRFSKFIIIDKALRKLGGYKKTDEIEHDRLIKEFQDTYGDSVENILKNRSPLLDKAKEHRGYYDRISNRIFELEKESSRNSGLIDRLSKRKRVLLKEAVDHERDLKEFDSKYKGDISGDLERIGISKALRDSAAADGRTIAYWGAGGALAGGGLGYGVASLVTREMDPEEEAEKIKAIKIGSTLAGGLVGGYSGSKYGKQRINKR